MRAVRAHKRQLRARSEAPDVVVETIHRNAASLVGFARRHSLCADDANDAYQRGIEIFLRRSETVEPETALAWLRTVIKHEAMAIRRSRLQLLGPEDVDLDLQESPTVPTPEEQIATFDRLASSAEAFQRLKPHEVRALWLKAQGLSYEEIGKVTGWSYTKVNRCLTEGRRAFLERFAEIESGQECERWTAVLSAMADGEATSEQVVQARPHLRNCPACRATLRAFHQATRDLGLVFPLPVAGAVTATAGDDRLPSFMAEVAASIRSSLAAARDSLVSIVARAPAGGESSGATVAGGTGALAAGTAKVAALCMSVTVAAGGAYCLDTSGVLEEKGTPPPRQDRRVRASARLIAVERKTDRRQRQAGLREQTTAAIRAEAIERQRSLQLARKRERTSRQTAANQTSAPPATPSPPPARTPQPTGQANTSESFTFESGGPAQTGSTGGSTNRAPPQPAQSQPSPPSGSEFDGAGFEK
jgi:RNA polymerase sigma factor (sigma-70 family)